MISRILAKASGNLGGGAGVEPTGSQRRMDQVAGKEIACEQKVMFGTIESAMARGVARKGNNL